jgi:hypothetical protein
MRTIWLKTGVAAALSLLGASASAQDGTRGDPDPTPLGSAGRELGTSARGLLTDPRRYFSRENFALSVGGGFTTFTQAAVEDITTPGGSWTVRGVFGMDQGVALEGAYVGAAYGVEPGTGDNGAVVSNGAELLLRIGLPVRRERVVILPYLTGGVGWAWYSLVNVDAAATGIRDDDGVFTIPFGLGFVVGYDRFSFDVRFLFRPAFGDEMFDNATASAFSPGENTLSVSGLVGYRF